MPHFSKSIETEQGSLNFYFNQFITDQGTGYHISTIGRDGKVYILSVEALEDSWKFVNNDASAYWLNKVEKDIIIAIQHHLVLNSKEYSGQ
jgi:hypothetical protein